jgi:hypothetical protein
MQEACFSRSSHDRLAKGSISGAISHVCQTFHKHSQPNPSLDEDGKTGFLLQQKLRAFKKADPAEKHQKGIPMLIISALAKQQLSKLDQAIIQLTGLSMFFAFRSCEYLKILQGEQHQMEQLCMRNICFFKDGEIIPYTHPALELTDCVSITFERQKQEDKHNMITQESSGDSVLCPMRFAAGLVRRIWSYKGTDSNTQVSAYISNRVVEHMALAQVINALQDEVWRDLTWKSLAQNRHPFDQVRGSNGDVPQRMPSVHNHAHWLLVEQCLFTVHLKAGHGIQP